MVWKDQTRVGPAFNIPCQCLVLCVKGVWEECACAGRASEKGNCHSSVSRTLWSSIFLDRKAVLHQLSIIPVHVTPLRNVSLKEKSKTPFGVKVNGSDFQFISHNSLSLLLAARPASMFIPAHSQKVVLHLLCCFQHILCQSYKFFVTKIFNLCVMKEGVCVESNIKCVVFNSTLCLLCFQSTYEHTFAGPGLDILLGVRADLNALCARKGSRMLNCKHFREADKCGQLPSF